MTTPTEYPYHFVKITTVLFLFSLLLLVSCSDRENEPPTVTTPGREVSNKVPDPGVTTNSSSEMTFVLQRYQRIEDMDKLGMLRCDSIGYACAFDPGGGSFLLCFLDDELVRATHAYSRGDHGGGSETYYFDGGDVFLADLSSSSWQFGGPMQKDEEGHARPGTEDQVHEERRFYYNGNLIDRKYKDYKIQSWTESPDPGSLPDQSTGIGVDDGIGSEVILQVARRGKYECE